MNKKKYLTEENYERVKRKFKLIALVVLIVGLLLGGGIITIGLVKRNNINLKYSEENKVKLQGQLDVEKQSLLTKKVEIEKDIQKSIDEINDKIDSLNKELAKLKSEQNKEFFKNGHSEKYYNLDNEIDMKENAIKEYNKQIIEEKNATSVIDSALNGTNSCSLGDAKNNVDTAKYCDLKNQLDDLNDFKKDFDLLSCIVFYGLGGFIIFVTFIIAGSIYSITKGRDLMAYYTQQQMPIVKEGIDEMAPTVGNAVKEITKGIKDGLKDDDK